MSGFFNKAKQVTGIGLDQLELYNRAFEKGVLLRKFSDAADIFDKAARKFYESGDQMMAAQAAANSLLYRYLVTSDPSIIPKLMEPLQGLQDIEVIGSQTERMPVGPLCAELDCRMVETGIAQAENDLVKSRDLHKLARDKFQVIMRNPLLTYSYVAAADGHNDRADIRYFYHSGMHQFYEAMTKKDADPSAAADDLSLANQAFRRCNDQMWQQKVSTLLAHWRISRTCWMCHREVQGYELHFSMYSAIVTPYTRQLLDKFKQDGTTMSIETKKIAICTPCGSMVTFKAADEADKVRQELTAKLNNAISLIQDLNNRVVHLERIAHHH